MVIQVGTFNARKLHEATRRIINFHCHHFVLVDSGDLLTIVSAAYTRGYFKIVLIL